jgi:hypothetical protein
LDSWRGLLRAPLFLKPQLPNHSLPSPCRQVRMMGGGPRTFPGGVTKWQWKRMQENKSKQLLKARLMRERQLYEMRKRAELRAATVNLESPGKSLPKPPLCSPLRPTSTFRAWPTGFKSPEESISGPRKTDRKAPLLMGSPPFGARRPTLGLFTASILVMPGRPAHSRLVERLRPGKGTILHPLINNNHSNTP